MLTFVGLGLYDERSVTVEGREAIAAADRVVAEFYTSRLAGASVADVEAFHGVEIEVRERAGVEEDPDDVLADAAEREVAFLTAGDPMISTTHVDLRLRARERGIDTRMIHGTTAAAAAASLTGLQNYRFGKATTLPFSHAGVDGVPDSVLATIEDNRERGLHTLAYLDIAVDRGRPGERGENRDEDGNGDGDASPYMTADVAASLLADAWEPDALGVAVCQAGSPDPVVAADRLAALAERSFGDPLHLLVLPGNLHHIEREALAAFGDAPDGALPAE